MVAGGMPAQQAYDTVLATWIKDGHKGPLRLSVTDFGQPPVRVTPVADANGYITPVHSANDIGQPSVVYGPTSNPYSGNGLLTVIMQVGTPSQREAAGLRLWANTGGTVLDHRTAGMTINNNANADSAWNSVLSQVMSGSSIEDAMFTVAKGNGGNVSGPKFDGEDVKAAMSVVAGL